MRGNISWRAVLTLFLLVVAGGVGSAYADAVIYEGFSYGGNISGNDGGIGFAGSWTSTRNNPQAVVPALTWGTLPVDGNTAQGNAWSGLTRPIGSTLADAGLMSDGATLWFSVIMDLTGQNTTNADINVALTTDKFVSNVFGDRENLAADDAEGIGVTHSGARIQGVYWQDDGGALDGVAERVENNSSTVINGKGDNLWLALIVGKIEWGADDTADETLTLYAPDEDLTAETPTMEAWTIPALDQSQFDLLAVQFKDSSKIDEVRFGATYDDVIGVTGPDIVVGDADGDGDVDAADYIMVKTHFGGAPAAGTEGTGGDFNENGTVDWDDLQTLLTGYNPTEGANPIPEPATLVIMLAAGLPALLKRRRRS